MISVPPSLLALAAVLALPADPPPVTAADVLVLENVNVVDVERAHTWPGHTVIVAGDRIEAVGPSDQLSPPSGARVVDGTGQYLIPGLWDMHVHLMINGHTDYAHWGRNLPRRLPRHHHARLGRATAAGRRHYGA